MASPCPCGSGREPARCCSEPLTDPELRYSSEDRERALRKMQTLLDRPTSRRFWKKAIEIFWADCIPEDKSAASEILSHPNIQGAFNGFLYWDIGAYGEQPLGDLVLEEFGKRLAPGERAFLRAGLESHWGLYEVLEARPGKGVVLEDLWHPRRIWVKEHSASKQMLRFDVLGGRVMKRPDGQHEFEGDLLDFACEHKSDLLALARELHEAERTDDPALSDAEFFKALLPALAQFWVHRLATPRPMPRIQTFEGDEWRLCSARFSARDRASLLRALDAAAELQRADEDEQEWTWIERDGALNRTLGRIELDGDALVLEVHSRERMERARAYLARLAPGGLELLETNEQSVDELMAERKARPSEERREEVPPEVRRELLGKYMDEHYRRWLDMEIPVLDGWTPRRAARDERMRSRVEDVLKNIENLEERKRRDGQFAYDAGWMWRELGLDRPDVTRTIGRGS